MFSGGMERDQWHVMSLIQNLRKNRYVIIQNSDKGNSVGIVHKTNYLDKIENLLNETRKFEKKKI